MNDAAAEVLNVTSPAPTTPQPQNDNLFQPNQPTATRIVSGSITLETGAPVFEKGGAGGSAGRSKYAPIFEQVRALKPGENGGWVKIPGDEKDLAHLRTALKRQGKFNPKVVKVRHQDAAKTVIAIFIPEGSDMNARDLDD